MGFNDHIKSSLNKIPLPFCLSSAYFEEVLLFLVPSWNEKGTQLQVLDKPENQVFEQMEIEKAPSWHAKVLSYLGKRFGIWLAF